LVGPDLQSTKEGGSRAQEGNKNQVMQLQFGKKNDEVDGQLRKSSERKNSGLFRLAQKTKSPTTGRGGRGKKGLKTTSVHCICGQWGPRKLKKGGVIGLVTGEN